jgi:hypothetical protein
VFKLEEQTGSTRNYYRTNILLCQLPVGLIQAVGISEFVQILRNRRVVIHGINRLHVTFVSKFDLKGMSQP